MKLGIYLTLKSRNAKAKWVPTPNSSAKEGNNVSDKCQAKNRVAKSLYAYYRAMTLPSL